MSRSTKAIEALKLVSHLQSRFVDGLERVSARHEQGNRFAKSEWLRDGGLHGGGNRFTATDSTIFNRASVNVSQIHYDDLPEKKLGSATAISTIIHPDNPHAPSVHIHISWTEMKNGAGYWRVMADLNPSVVHEQYRDKFRTRIEELATQQFVEASAQGDRYFHIPALERHRGVAHFYLEDYFTDDPARDREFARKFGEGVIDCYLEILESALRDYETVSDAERAEQLAYHTLYLFQVLTLDRGTTSGLLVHDQNDLGIMGSLPSHVNRDLLLSWKEKVGNPQDRLVQDLVDALPQGSRIDVNDEVKLALAKTVRAHYKQHPEALSLQASGNVVPPTVDNHK